MSPTLRDHGVVTWFLLEGLRGGADLDGNGSVTVLELYQYLSPRVQDYARQRFQADQTPVLEVRGLSGEITLAGRRTR